MTIRNDKRTAGIGLSAVFVSVLAFGLGTGCSTAELELAEAEQTLSTQLAPLYGDAVAETIADRYIVVFDDAQGAGEVSALAAELALTQPKSRIEHTLTVLPAAIATLAPEDLDAVRRHPGVAYVERDQVLRAAWKPEPGPAGEGEDVGEGDGEYRPDTSYPLPGGQPTGIDRVDQPSLPLDGVYDDHDCDGSGTRVYVIDTGVRSTHTEFHGRVDIARGFTAIADGNGTEDCLGTGTHVASTAAGRRYGMAKQASVVPVRVLSCSGSGSNAGVIAGVNHVAADCAPGDACVAVMTLGGGASLALDTAVNNLVASGVPVAVSAGSGSCTGSPATAAAATTVAAVGSDDCSNISGSCVDIYAPATSILGASASSDTASAVFSGMSAPAHAAGAMAQALSCGLPGAPAVTDATCTSTGAVLPLVYNDFSGSCVGRCGDLDTTEVCQCDAGCSARGDCCADIADECPCNAANACGGAAAGCYCDSVCTVYGDCCSDGPC